MFKTFQSASYRVLVVYLGVVALKCTYSGDWHLKALSVLPRSSFELRITISAKYKTSISKHIQLVYGANIL